MSSRELSINLTKKQENLTFKLNKMKRVTLCVTLGKNIDENNPKMITVAY